MGGKDLTLTLRNELTVEDWTVLESFSRRAERLDRTKLIADRNNAISAGDRASPRFLPTRCQGKARSSPLSVEHMRWIAYPLTRREYGSEILMETARRRKTAQIRNQAVSWAVKSDSRLKTNPYHLISLGVIGRTETCNALLFYQRLHSFF
jgi:hypothetical protein